MSFSIHFVPANEIQPLELHDHFQYGRITIDDFSELFEAPLHYWSVEDYENHWKNALHRIVHQSKTSCLITSIYNPKRSNFLMWWPLYRKGDIVYIQNHFLFYKKAKYWFDVHNPYRNISPRRIIGSGGKRISEWRTSIEEINQFLETLSADKLSLSG